MANFCSNCGKPLSPGAKFCENCGSPVAPAAPPVQAPAAPPAPEIPVPTPTPVPNATPVQPVAPNPVQPAPEAPLYDSKPVGKIVKKFRTAVDACNFAMPFVLQWRLSFDELADQEEFKTFCGHIDSELHIPEGHNDAYFVVDINGAVGFTEDAGKTVSWIGTVHISNPQVPERVVTDAPGQVIVDEAKRKGKDFLKRLTFRGMGKKLLWSGIALVATWTFCLIGQKICIRFGWANSIIMKLMRVISFITFSDGGSSRNLFYLLGGLLGKSFVMATLFAFVLGGYKKVGRGFKKLMKLFKSLGKLPLLALFFWGAAAAMILYNFFCGRAAIHLSMVGIVGVISMLWALGGGVHFLRRMIVSLTADQSRTSELRFVNLEKAMPVIGGMAIGFAFSVLTTFMMGFGPVGGFIHYINGLQLAIAGLVIFLIARKKTAAVAVFLLLLAPIHAFAQEGRTMTFKPDDKITARKVFGIKNDKWYDDYSVSGQYVRYAKDDAKVAEFVIDIERESMYDLGRNLIVLKKDSWTSSQTVQKYQGRGKSAPRKIDTQLYDLYCAQVSEDITFVTTDKQRDKLLNDPNFDEFSVAGKRAYKRAFHYDPKKEYYRGMPFEKAIYNVVLDEDYFGGNPLVLTITVTVSVLSADSNWEPKRDHTGGFFLSDNYKGSPGLMRRAAEIKKYADDGLLDGLAQEAVCLPFSYKTKVTTAPYMEKAKPEKEGRTIVVIGPAGTTPGPNGPLLPIAIIIVSGPFLIVLLGNEDDYEDEEEEPEEEGGYPPFGTLGGDKWIRIEDDVLTKRNPVTGEDSYWVDNGDGTYSEMGTGETKSLDDLREESDYADRNRDRLRRGYLEQQQAVAQERERLRKEIEEKNKYWEKERVRRAAEKAAREKKEKYIEQLKEKYFTFNEDDLRNDRLVWEQKKGEEFAEAYNKAAKFADYAYKTASFVKDASEWGVDALAEVTGPVGKGIQLAYKGLSELSYTTAEALCREKSWSSFGKGLALGTVKGGIYMVQTKVCSGKNEPLKYFTNIVSESSKSGIAAYNKGKTPTQIMNDMIDGGINGLTYSVADQVSGKVAGKLGKDMRPDLGTLTEDGVSGVCTLIDDIFKTCASR